MNFRWNWVGAVMEIIGTVSYTGLGIFFIVCSCILFVLVGVIITMVVYDEELLKGFTVSFLTIVFAILFLVLGISFVTGRNRLKLKVDQNITIDQIKQEYDIVKYDSESDVWIVTKKDID